jgi:hypothetical protein
VAANLPGAQRKTGVAAKLQLAVKEAIRSGLHDLPIDWLLLKFMVAVSSN